MNARQKRLFEDALKRNPNLKVPSEEAPPAGEELTADDLALLKQGVGDKSSKPSSAGGPTPFDEDAAATGNQTGTVAKYFDDKGYGFIRPDDGSRDIFFHVSKLIEGLSTDLMPNTKVGYELGMDRYGKTNAINVRILPPPAE